jgi:hypothetical protein
LRALVAAGLFLVACATAPHPRPWPPPPPEGPAGECEPAEYSTLPCATAGDTIVRVELGADGAAERAGVVESSGDRTQDDIALDIALHALACRHRLADGASRVIERYAVHFRKLQQLPRVDNVGCGLATRYSDEALEYGIVGRLQFRVALDEQGHVVRAWGNRPYRFGLHEAAIEALEQRCRFTPGLADGKPVPFVLVYTFEFQLPR